MPASSVKLCLLLLASAQWRANTAASLEIPGGQQAAVSPPAAAVAMPDATPPEAAAMPAAGSDETPAGRADNAQQQARAMSGGDCADAKTTAACNNSADAKTTAASTTCADAATNATTCAPKKTADCKTTADELRNRVAQLTDELCKMEAALTIAQQLEHKLALLEREKYCHVKTASDNVLRLVDKLEYAEKKMAAETSRQQRYQKRLAQTHRLANRSAHRLQVIRRLLAGAEVGLVHMESTRKLSPDYNRRAQ